jgi:hypothetical protein
VILEFPLCSLYFSSLLASLNAREYVRGGSTEISWNEAPTKITRQPSATSSPQETSTAISLDSMKFRNGSTVNTATDVSGVSTSLFTLGLLTSIFILPGYRASKQIRTVVANVGDLEEGKLKHLGSDASFTSAMRRGKA